MEVTYSSSLRFASSASNSFQTTNMCLNAPREIRIQLLLYVMRFHKTLTTGLSCNTVYREILTAIKFGEIARNRFDKYWVNLKFGDSDVITRADKCIHNSV